MLFRPFGRSAVRASRHSSDRLSKLSVSILFSLYYSFSALPAAPSVYAFIIHWRQSLALWCLRCNFAYTPTTHLLRSDHRDDYTHTHTLF